MCKLVMAMESVFMERAVTMSSDQCDKY